MVADLECDQSNGGAGSAWLAESVLVYRALRAFARGS
jgi:hypothetical protein